jgi:hypothetical protein
MEAPAAVSGRGGNAMGDLYGGAEEWISEAVLALRAAEELLAAGLCEEALTDAFMAMVYAARAHLEEPLEGAAGWEDVVRSFQADALPRLNLSKENQRALPIVAELYRQVIQRGEMEADPVTVAACLEDARSFLGELSDLA